jgi:hypothetical protein
MRLIFVLCGLLSTAPDYALSRCGWQISLLVFGHARPPQFLQERRRVPSTAAVFSLRTCVLRSGGPALRTCGDRPSLCASALRRWDFLGPRSPCSLSLTDREGDVASMRWFAGQSSGQRTAMGQQWRCPRPSESTDDASHDLGQSPGEPSFRGRGRMLATT